MKYLHRCGFTNVVTAPLIVFLIILFPGPAKCDYTQGIKITCTPTLFRVAAYTALEKRGEGETIYAECKKYEITCQFGKHTMKVSFTTDEPRERGLCGAAPGSDVNIWMDGQQIIKQQLFNNECYESLMSASFEQTKDGHFVFKICGHGPMPNYPINNECFEFQEEAFRSLPKPLPGLPITELKKKDYLKESHAAGFDCGKARSEVEKTICGNEELSRLDDSLNKAYQQALEQALFKKQTIKSQRRWLKKERNTCHHAECIKQAYESRIKELAFLSSYVTIYSWNADSVVNLAPFQPLSEAFKAVLAMYSLQTGSYCKGGIDNLKCDITSSLGFSTQCSKEQIDLVRKWFKEGIPKMGGYGDRLYKETQKLGNLESICYNMPEGASIQNTWDNIKVGIRKNLVFVDAVFHWTEGSDGPSGYTGYSTIYRIAKDRIITVSHKKVLDERDED
jgi:uncharacterized protein YecT (DUF1311 family)